MKRLATILALLATALVASATPAVATHLITGKEIRNGSVAERDLSKGVQAKLRASGRPGPAGPAGAPGIDGADGTDGLNGSDGEPGAPGVDGADGADGVQGPRGETGERGPQGDPGPRGFPGQDGVSGLTIVSSEPLIVFANAGTHPVDQACPTGKDPLSGGYRVQAGDATVQSSYPTNTGWHVDFIGSAGSEVRVYVVCAKA